LHFSLKIKNFDPKKQIQQNNQIKLSHLILKTINLFDSNWWYSYREINVLTRPVLNWFQDSSKTGSGINFFPTFLAEFFVTFFCCLFAAFFVTFLLTFLGLLFGALF
jgi:hypothetical protein